MGRNVNQQVGLFLKLFSTVRIQDTHITNETEKETIYCAILGKLF